MARDGRKEDTNESDSAAALARMSPLATRVLVWGLLLLVIYFLRSFFLLVFLTFVFSYIQANGVERLAPYIRNRTVRVVFSGLVLLGVLIAIGAFIVPRVRQQAETFAVKFPSYLDTLDLKLAEVSQRYPSLRDVVDFTPDKSHEHSSMSRQMLQQLFTPDSNGSDQQSVRSMVEAMRNIGGSLLAAGSAFLLSLLFSFLIVLDLPNLIKGVRSLADTRIGFVYREVSGSIRDFARVLGRALEAQLFIALLNSILTAFGITFILGLGDSVAFLSLIVFLCSFIPVAGVFISSIPICLLALEKAGISLMVVAILFITVVHLIEAYILNPKIYGHHLRMNPVIVLIILTIAGKMFHVWGLVLGVPVCNYVFGHAIRYRRGE